MSDQPSPEERAEQLAAAILAWGGCFDCCSDSGTAFDRVSPGDGWINDRLAPALRGLVEAARADERAKVLADVDNIARASSLSATDVRLILDAIREMSGLEWEHATRHRPVRVPCDCDNPTHAVLAGDDSPPTHASLEAVPSRRLVGPWEPVADEGGAS